MGSAKMKTIFGLSYFKTKVPQHETFKKYIMSQYSIDKSKPQENWNSETRTVYFSKEELLPVISKCLDDFCAEVEKPLQFALSDPWINFYTKGDYQEIHTHPRYQLSLNYFLNYDKDTDAKFYFYNPRSNEVAQSGLDLLFDVGDCYTPDVEEGDLIIFPGYMHHGVRTHKSENTRVTVTCNMMFRLCQSI